MQGTKPILALNRFDGAAPPSADARLRERLAKRHAAFGAASVLFYAEPIELVRGHGVFLYDLAGHEYLDMYNNVPSVGHCHPHVVSAIAAQAARLNIHTRYLTRPVEEYAERLLRHFPAPLTNLTMTCTGSESNDLALRIASAVTGAKGFIVTRAAYHGNTAAVTAISPSSFSGGKVAPHVRLIDAPAVEATAPGTFTAQLRAAMADLAASGFGFAALVVDSIFSSDGIFADPPGFLQDALAAVHEAGGLFIADEVQPGFGRTGGGLWGFTRHGITPDIVTMGKPMGNGFPMGGVVTRPEFLARSCAETGYFNTFGGNPVAAAAGDAVLDVIEEEGLIQNAAATGALLTQGLEALAKDFAGIHAVRGAGLFIGVDFCTETGAPDPARATQVINALRQKFILIGAAGLHGHTLKIRPPLCFKPEHATRFLETLRDILHAA